MKADSPRILYVSSCWPHDRACGGQLRALNIGRALQKFAEVTLTVVSQDRPDDGSVRRTAAEFLLDPPVRVEMSPKRGWGERLRWTFDPRYLNFHGCAARAEDRARLLDRGRSFDLIWILDSRTPNILGQWRWPHTVLDMDDVPSTYQRSIWQNAVGPKERIKAGLLVPLLRRRERLWRERFTTLAVCSEADRRYLGGGEHIHVIPNGFERPREEPRRSLASPPRLGFIGLFSYPPNVEGVRWFIRECWPGLKREIPDVRLRLMGKDTDGPLKPVAPDVDALGWVADPAAEIATWSAMITPVRTGAGTRIKIADAFSRKCPVVSTKLGAFGYEVQHGRELLLADDPPEFAAACGSLIRDREMAAGMAERAFNLYIEKWTWDAIAPKVRAAAEDGLRSRA